MGRKKNQDNEADEREDITVTLTLDDDRELECAIITIFEAGGRDYIALLPLDDVEAEEGEVIFTATAKKADNRSWKTFRMTKNTKSHRMPLMNSWTLRNTTRLSVKKIWRI